MKKISILLITIILFIGCKNEPNITYHYQQKDDLFYCDAIDMNLIKEAIYAFEDYVENHYFMEPPKSLEKEKALKSTSTKYEPPSRRSFDSGVRFHQ